MAVLYITRSKIIQKYLFIYNRKNDSYFYQNTRCCRISCAVVVGLGSGVISFGRTVANDLSKASNRSPIIAMCLRKINFFVCEGGRKKKNNTYRMHGAILPF